MKDDHWILGIYNQIIENAEITLQP